MNENEGITINAESETF